MDAEYGGFNCVQNYQITGDVLKAGERNRCFHQSQQKLAWGLWLGFEVLGGVAHDSQTPATLCRRLIISYSIKKVEHVYMFHLFYREFIK